MTAIQTPTGDERFDVAFSFVSREDLSVAKKLRDLLEPVLCAFVYTDHQDIVGGGEGMTAYGNVFRNETRLAVILLRPDWGKTQWTAVEEAAIRDRSLRTGGRSYMVVSMEEGLALPSWIPWTTIYQQGWREPLLETAAVIRARARDAGAVLKVESALDIARKRARHFDVARERDEMMKSPRGAAAGRNEAIRLMAEVSRLADEFTTALPELQLRAAFEVLGQGRRIGGQLIGAHGSGLSLFWDQPINSSLNGARLHVREVSAAGGYSWSFYEFVLTDDGEPAWRWDRDADNAGTSGIIFMSSSPLEAVQTSPFAERRVAKLTEYIQRFGRS
ncbi:MAG: hypothetical protein JWM95_3270 [Gemmatimonadetes bacterium]|nr:hypothetical protein [Gemmatimonadota bacterium]